MVKYSPSVHMSLSFWVCPKSISINFDRLYQIFYKILQHKSKITRFSMTHIYRDLHVLELY
jgi:hypothetical protein